MLIRARNRKWVATALVVLSCPIAIRALARQSALIDAVRQSDIATFRALLPKADVNAPEEDGTTALHWAVHLENAVVVDLLIKAGAKVDAANRYQVTPMSLACDNGDAAIIERLLKAGVSASRRFDTGETALMTAARSGHTEAVRVLVAHGADVNARDSYRGQTALMWAAGRGSVDVVKMLLEAGADVHAKTPTVSRPDGNIAGGSFEALDASGKASSTTGFSYLEPDPSAFSALMFAVREDHTEVVKALLDGGANVNDKLSNGMTPLILAVANRHYELAAHLLDRGADPNDNSVGWTALHQAIHLRRGAMRSYTTLPRSGTMDDFEFIRKLVASGVHVNARTWRHLRDSQRVRYVRVGATPFFFAAKLGDLQVMQLLLANGANPFTPTVENITPLMAAAGVALFNPGEDAGSNPEHMAERFEAVKMLVALGSDVNAATIDKETPLHGAVYLGHKAMVEYLIEHGARLDARNDRNWTPLTVALGAPYAEFFKEFPDLVPVLRHAMAERGLSTEGQEHDRVSDPGECKHCFFVRGDEAQRFVDLQRKFEDDKALVASLRAAE